MAALLQSSSAQAASASYTYDAAGRLAGVNYGNGKTITYTYDSAGSLLVRQVSAGITQRTLQIVSARGTPSPAVGIHTNNNGTTLTNVVSPQVTVGTTQYVCTGWAMTGNGPVSGTSTSVVMTLTNNAVLTWKWGQTNYLLNTTAGANGSVNVSDGWHPLGTSVVITATASNHYHFSAWSGDTNGCVLNGGQLTAPMSGPRHITASFSIDAHTLQVASAHGTPGPAVGIHTNAYGAGLTNVVGRKDTQGTTQYVCSGWTMTGNSPVSGASTSVVMTLTNNAALTWNWNTLYLLNATSGPNGSVAASNGWYDAGATGVVLTATAATNYSFVGWTGTVVTTTNPLIITMDRPHQLTASFTGRAPTNPVLASPSGLITTSRPEFVWNAVEYAASYELWVNRFGTSYLAVSSVTTNYVATNDLPFGIYQWWVKALNVAGAGNWSSSLSFSNVSVTPAGPTGVVVDTLKPEFSWTPATGATWYRLWITKSGSLFRQQWVKGTNKWTFTEAFSAGEYQWRVMAWCSAGGGPWSEAVAFTIPNAPGQTTLLAPSGVITTGRPEFAWTSVTNARWYRLWVNRNDVVHTNAWVNGQTNAYQFGSDLSYGKYKWWIMTWNYTGEGPWSDPLDFTYGLSTPLTPTGLVTSTREPAFSWTAVPGAAWYLLWVNRNNALYTNKWVNGVMTNYTVAATLPGGGLYTNEFPSGDYEWWIRPWKAGGEGPWSAAAEFSISNTLPQKVTLVSPTGVVAGAVVNYTWQSEPGATWYQLWVRAGPVDFHSEWYKTGIGTGQVIEAVGGHATNTAYRWWVRGWGPDGLGLWSAGNVFTVE